MAKPVINSWGWSGICNIILEQYGVRNKTDMQEEQNNTLHIGKYIKKNNL